MIILKIVLGIPLYLSIGFGLAAVFNLFVPGENDDFILDFDSSTSLGIMFAWPVVVPLYFLLTICIVSWHYLEQIFERIQEDAKIMRKAQQEIMVKEEQKQNDLTTVENLTKQVQKNLYALTLSGYRPKQIVVSKQIWELMRRAMIDLLTPTAAEKIPTFFGLPVEVGLGMDDIDFFILTYEPEEESHDLQREISEPIKPYVCDENIEENDSVADIVRCKDCRYCWKMRPLTPYKENEWTMWCMWYMNESYACLTTPESYCSHGKKMDGEE